MEGSELQAAGQRSVEAAAAQPAAAPELADEAVWRLLLGQLRQQPDVSLVCRLLRCSAAMRQLVQEKCAGRCAATTDLQPVASADAPEQGRASAQCSSNWLEKHGWLLARLELKVPGPWRPADTLILPRGGTLQALMAPHQQRLTAVLRGLPHLRDLDLQAGITLPPLQLGMQLTRLHLKPLHWWLGGPAKALRALPASLRVLESGKSDGAQDISVEDIAHLTALRRLRCSGLLDGAAAQLPVSLQELEVRHHQEADLVCLLRHLSRLQRLKLLDSKMRPASLQDLLSAIGPSLTALEVESRIFWSHQPGLGHQLVSQRITAGVVPPLTGLRVMGLRCLHLIGVCMLDTPRVLAEQLGQLTALTALDLPLQGPEAVGSDGPALQPLVDCIVGMGRLRRLNVCHRALTAQQVAALEALTHVTQLRITCWS